MTLSKRLLVGNLSLKTTEKSLETLFSQVGMVRSVTLATDPRTEKLKGFAVVEMGSIKEAQAALNELAGVEIEGRAINIHMTAPSVPKTFMERCLKLLGSD